MNNPAIKWFPAVALLLCSCDLLRSSPFEVSAWSPGWGAHTNPASISLSLTFSHEPDRASVERHFSFTEDGSRLAGTVQWKGRTLLFLPAAPLETNRDYALGLSADACDTTGLSLDAAFEGRFSTSPGGARPALVSVFPEPDGVVTDSRAEARLVFSLAVPLNSLREYVSFSPSMDGYWRCEPLEQGTAAIFVPAEPWTYGKRYELRVSEALAGENGMSMGRDFLSVFTIGDDHAKPYLMEARRVTANGDEAALDADTENAGWERTDTLRLLFSEPVNMLSVRNCLGVEDAPGLIMATAPADSVFCREIDFRFDGAPVFASRFTFRLKAGVTDQCGNESAGEYMFRVCADGIHSKPPALVGIRLPLSPGNAADLHLQSYGYGIDDDLFADLLIESGDGQYPYGAGAGSRGTPTWIECYFDTAPGAAVDPLSLMERFRVEAGNNALSFSPRRVLAGGFSVSTPCSRWEPYQRLEIQGYLANTVNSGVVNIQIAAGLRDSAGNAGDTAYRISLVK